MYTEQQVNALIDMGLNRMEAEVYLTLILHSSSTGYRIAKIIGKAAPNIYNTLDTLIKKGAVVIDEFAKPKKFSAVPPEEFAGAMEKNFKNKSEQMTKELSTLGKKNYDDQILRLTSTDQLYERFERMLENAEKTVIVDAFPGPLKKIKPVLEKTAKKGVHILLTAYEPVEISGVVVSIKPHSEKIFERWPGEWLNAVCDHSENLQALLGKDDNLLEAIWVKSPYLSCNYANGLIHEFLFTALINMIKEEPVYESVRDYFNQFPFLMPTEAPGYLTLLERLGQKK